MKRFGALAFKAYIDDATDDRFVVNPISYGAPGTAASELIHDSDINAVHAVTHPDLSAACSSRMSARTDSIASTIAFITLDRSAKYRCIVVTSPVPPDSWSRYATRMALAQPLVATSTLSIDTETQLEDAYAAADESCPSQAELEAIHAISSETWRTIE